MEAIQLSRTTLPAAGRRACGRSRKAGASGRLASVRPSPAATLLPAPRTQEGCPGAPARPPRLPHLREEPGVVLTGLTRGHSRAQRAGGFSDRWGGADAAAGSDAGPPLRCPWTGCRASPARRRTELSGGSGGAGLWEERLSSCLGPTPQTDPSQDVLTLT